MGLRWKLPLFIVLVVVAVIAAVRPLDRAPVEVVPASEQDRFSAERAFAHLEKLLAENVPHPAGTEANRVIADRIEGTLRAAGYEPEIQEGFKCSPLAPGCSVVRNIIAVHKGRDPSHAVLVTAHYDSVPGSAAAGDDGAGIATMLEVAERLPKREPLLHDVVFLFADAEETGLRGAMHFADSHPLMEKIAFVLNMEARGVSGSSVMFETGPENAALIAAFAGAVRNPVSNSLLFEAYRRMPNNTDFTVYKWKQVSGLNFAFVRGVALYHSERDDLGHLDRTSLQHHGDNVYGALLKIADTPVADLEASTDATYFDVAGRFLVHWPNTWNAILAGIGLVLVIVAGVRNARANIRAVAWTVLAIVLLHVLIVVAGWLLSWPTGRWPELHPLDHPQPWPARIAAIAAAVAVTFAVASVFARRVSPGATLTIVWAATGLEALAVAFVLPGLSYVFIAPLLAYGVIAVIETLVRRDHPPYIGASVAFIVATYMALYHFLMLDALLNFDKLHAKAIALVIMMLPLFPLALAYLQRERAATSLATSLVVAAVAAVAAMLVPTHTVDRPRSVNLVYVQENATGAAYWQIESFGEPGQEVLDAMGFEEPKQAMMHFGVLPADSYRKPASNQRLLAPIVEIEADMEAADVRVVRGTVRSARSAYQLGLGFPADSPVTQLRVEGQSVLESAASEPRTVRLHGVGAEPIRFELRARPGEALSLSVFDIGVLPPNKEAHHMLTRRPEIAAPLQLGNHSIVVTELSL